MKLRTAVAGLMVAGTLVSAAMAQPYPTVAPPPAVVEAGPPPPAPGARYVLVPGYYRWAGGAYVWVPRHWQLRPVGYTRWVPGHWNVGPFGRWHWIPGHWV